MVTSDRLVHNSINATFAFQDGKIIRHQDNFDFWKWTRMALGASGIFMGWSSVVQGKVRETAVASSLSEKEILDTDFTDFTDKSTLNHCLSVKSVSKLTSGGLLRQPASLNKFIATHPEYQ